MRIVKLSMHINDVSFNNDIQEAMKQLGRKRKDNLLRILRNEYTEGVDWVRAESRRLGKRGPLSATYKMTDNCIQTIMVRDKSRASEMVNSMEVGGIRFEYVRRIVPAGVETISFLKRAFDRLKTLTSEYKVGVHRVDLYK